MKVTALFLQFSVIASVSLFILQTKETASCEETPRVAIFGIDGADWRIIAPLIEAGELPHLASLMERGVYGDFESFEPMLSPMLWTSIATGKYPEKHGIIDFTAFDRRQNRVVPVSSNLRKARTVWDILSEYNYTVGIVGWLATWPSEPVNGFLLSDRLVYHAFDPPSDVSGEQQGLVYPRIYETELPRLRESANTKAIEFYHRFGLQSLLSADPPLASEAQQGLKQWQDLLHSMAMTQTVGLDVYKRSKPRFFAIYYEYVDAAGHLFMRYTPPDYPGVTQADQKRFGNWVNETYRLQDELLGEFLAILEPGTNVVVISDHGFLSGEQRPMVDSRIESGGAPAWHRRHGIFLWNGPALETPGRFDRAHLVDIAPSVLAVFGVPIGQDMDGQPLEILLRRCPEPRWVPTHEKSREEGTEETAVEPIVSELDEAILNRLKALGYLGGHTSPTTDANESIAQSQYNLGLSLEKRDRFPEAIEAYRAVLLENPTHETGRFHMAYCLMRLNRWQAAANVLQGLLKLNPHNIQARNNLGYCFVHLGQQDQAMGIFQAMIRDFPKDPRGYSNLGAYLLEQEEIQSAQAYLEKASQLNPNDATIHENLALCLLKSGKVEEGRRQQDRAKEIRAQQIQDKQESNQ